VSIPTEPLFLGARYVQIKFYAAPRNPGDPSTIVGTLTLMPDENVLVLDAIKGDKGDRGDPAPFWRPEWGSTITNPADLNALNLGADDVGRAWYISGYWHVWTGDDFFTFLGAIPGPIGPTPVITMSAEQILAPAGGPYGTIAVDPGGSPEEPSFHLRIPGIVGPQGENARIGEATDVFNMSDIQEGQALLWSATAGGPVNPGFAPGDPSPFAMRWITFPETSFGPGGTYSAAQTVVLSAPVPAQASAYYPYIEGRLGWQRSTFLGFEISSAQIEVHVRVLPDPSTSSPETGALCARALYDPSTLDAATICSFGPHHSDFSNPSRSVNPDSSVGRIAAGQAVRVYVILVKVGGNGSYVYSVDGSYLSYAMFPVS
jgi:hypothetical protein